MNIEDFSQICRLCLIITDTGQSIFQDNVANFLSLIELPARKDDIFPKTVCPSCTKYIEGIFTFIQKCKEANDTLVKISEKGYEVDQKDDLPELFDEIKTEEVDSIDIKSHNEAEKESKENPRYKISSRISCKNCKKTFKTKSILGRHYVENEDCRPSNFKIHKCEVCNKDYGSLRHKAEHMNIHTGKLPYVCSYCGRGFKFHSKLYVHVYRHKLALGLVAKKDCYTEKRVKLHLKCEECGKIYASRSGYDKHLQKHKGRVIIRKKNAPSITNKDNRAYLCNYCGKSFYVKANLDNHLRVHTGERPFKCDDCGQRFKQKGALDRHALNHLVNRPKPHQCDVCSKCFTTKAHMEIHKRLHTGKKPYECSYCKKHFNYKSHWKIHLRMHTGESPYACDVCNNRYHDRGSLKKHQHKKGHLTKP